jgi:chemotaxis protein methyltransferase CheR
MAFTYFFRDSQTLDTIVADVLPALQGYQYIRIWDAGCAHGPEPYSIAIMLRERMSHFMFRNVRIDATDVDSQFGRIIEEGVYPVGEVERIPPAIKQKYFTETERMGYYKIDDEIRSCVKFSKHDLLSLKPIRGELNLIVCKNVLLHLKPEERVDVIGMFFDALREGGFLAMEHTQEMPDRVKEMFEPITCSAQVFRKVSTYACQRVAA